MTETQEGPKEATVGGIHLTPRVRGAQYGVGATVFGRPRYAIRATAAICRAAP